MHLYTPTEFGKQDLIDLYTGIINNPVHYFFILIFSIHTHYRFYFIDRFTDDKYWNAYIEFVERVNEIYETDRKWTINISMYFLIGLLLSYYCLAWLIWLISICWCYRTIRREAPMKLLELN